MPQIHSRVRAAPQSHERSTSIGDGGVAPNASPETRNAPSTPSGLCRWLQNLIPPRDLFRRPPVAAPTVAPAPLTRDRTLRTLQELSYHRRDLQSPSSSPAAKVFHAKLEALHLACQENEINLATFRQRASKLLEELTVAKGQTSETSEQNGKIRDDEYIVAHDNLAVLVKLCARGVSLPVATNQGSAHGTVNGELNTVRISRSLDADFLSKRLSRPDLRSA